MSASRFVLMALSTGVLLVAAGCKGGPGNCRKPQAYATAEALPPLRIPVGLDGPDTRAALKIPELNEPEAPRGAKDPCLEEPPQANPPAAAPAATR